MFFASQEMFPETEASMTKEKNAFGKWNNSFTCYTLRNIIYFLFMFIEFLREIFESRYSRINRVKFAEDSL